MTDFGIARSLDVQHGMTQTGTVLGTSDYIAPEQAQGQRVDEHTDVYSLGVVLYELLTSEVPFPGENFVAVAMRHINEEPPSIRDKRPDVLAAASRPRSSGRWRRSRPTASRRWPTFCQRARGVPRRGAAARRSRAAVAPKRSRAARGRRRGISPWPLIAAARGAARDRRGRRGAAHPRPPARARARRPRAAAPAAAPVTCAPSRPYDPYGTRRRARRRASASATDGNAGDVLGDRALPQRAAASASRASASSWMRARRCSCSELGIATVDAGLHRGDPRRRLADARSRPTCLASQTVDDGTTLHDRRRRATATT